MKTTLRLQEILKMGLLIRRVDTEGDFRKYKKNLKKRMRNGYYNIKI